MPTFLYQIKPLPHPLFASIHPLTQRKNMSLIKAPPPPHFWMLDIRRITVNGEPLFSDNQWEPVGYTGRRTQVPRETSENPGGVPPSPCKSGRFQGKTAFVSLSSSWIKERNEESKMVRSNSSWFLTTVLCFFSRHWFTFHFKILSFFYEFSLVWKQIAVPVKILFLSDVHYTHTPSPTGLICISWNYLSL